MNSHEVAIALASEYKNTNLNEADTRHQIIDKLIHNVFNWPENRVKCEEFVAPGYLDYALIKPDNKKILLIEAKRESHYFTLPSNLLTNKSSGYITTKTLLTDVNIREAIIQVKSYCTDIGCEIAAIINGRQWIFFRTFLQGEDWRELKAFVISDLSYFSDFFTEANNHFSYTEIVEKSSLRRLLLDQSIFNRELYYPSTKVTNYGAPVESNGFASMLRPITERYFGKIEVDDTIFMDNCYVNDREYDRALSGTRQILEDSLTPFLQQYNIQDFQDNDGGGGFGRRIQKSITANKRTEVLVLFGGKGVGKSTFLRRTLFHKAPQTIKKHGAIAYVDLLPDALNEKSAAEVIWQQLIEQLDEDKVLSSNRLDLCTLFSDRVGIALGQNLYGLDPSSTEYNTRLNDLIADWKKDSKYVSKQLTARLRLKHKHVIAVIDNTDQFSEELQDQCFQIAQEISAHLGCLALISMREERFHASSIYGILDAYQNSGYHITSPQPNEVFLKRIGYVRNLIKQHPNQGDYLPDHIDKEIVDKLLRILETEFRNSKSHLASFLTACSHGNIRLALELFRGFVVSGYTNVQEMTSESRWTLQIHQVIKPFMIPSRFFYAESESKIPNLFQIRHKPHGSHFTACRIISLLSSHQDGRAASFTPVSALFDFFVEHYSMREDLINNLDLLLKYGLVETNKRVENFSDAIDTLRPTSYGLYLLNSLSTTFTYLELCSLDCAVGDQTVSNTIAQLSNDEYRHYLNYDTVSRMRSRISKSEEFIKYLEREELREVDRYGSHFDNLFTKKIRHQFDSTQHQILKGAMKNSKNKLPSINGK